MAEARPWGPWRGSARPELLQKMTLLKRGGPQRAEPAPAPSSASCWSWWGLFRRPAARSPSRKKAKLGRGAKAGPERGLWGHPRLQRLLQRLSMWRRYLRRRQPKRREEIPLLELHRSRDKD